MKRIFPLGLGLALLLPSQVFAQFTLVKQDTQSESADPLADAAELLLGGNIPESDSDEESEEAVEAEVSEEADMLDPPQEKEPIEAAPSADDLESLEPTMSEEPESLPAGDPVTPMASPTMPKGEAAVDVLLGQRPTYQMAAHGAGFPAQTRPSPVSVWMQARQADINAWKCYPQQQIHEQNWYRSADDCGGCATSACGSTQVESCGCGSHGTAVESGCSSCSSNIAQKRAPQLPTRVGTRPPAPVSPVVRSNLARLPMMPVPMMSVPMVPAPMAPAPMNNNGRLPPTSAQPGRPQPALRQPQYQQPQYQQPQYQQPVGSYNGAYQIR